MTFKVKNVRRRNDNKVELEKVFSGALIWEILRQLKVLRKKIAP
jgi:hypothetical protein